MQLAAVQNLIGKRYIYYRNTLNLERAECYLEVVASFCLKAIILHTKPLFMGSENVVY